MILTAVSLWWMSVSKQSSIRRSSGIRGGSRLALFKLGATGAVGICVNAFVNAAQKPITEVLALSGLPTQQPCVDNALDRGRGSLQISRVVAALFSRVVPPASGEVSGRWRR